MILNFAMDTNHPSLSNQFDVVNSLRTFYKQIYVITGNCPSRQGIPSNVKVIDLKWGKRNKVRILIDLSIQIVDLVKNHDCRLFFTHMNDTFAMVAAPITKLLRVEHVFWYAHAHPSVQCRIGAGFSTLVVSSTTGSYPLNSKHCFFIGQGIDVSKFKPKIKPRRNSRALFVGRLDPSKGLDKCIDVFLNFGSTLSRMDIVGEPSESRAEKELNRLKSRRSLEIQSKKIEFLGALPRNSLVTLYQQYAVFLHGFTGSLDKVLIEATLSKCPVVTLNQEYIQEFGTWGTDSSLEGQLHSLLLTPKEKLDEELERRMNIAVEKHSLEQWICRLLEIFDSYESID